MEYLFKYKNVLGFNVLDEDFDVFLAECFKEDKNHRIVNTISPNSYGITTYDQHFKQALKQTILVLDGVYFALGSILMRKGKVIENQGPHITYKALNFANSNSLKVFFLGSTQDTLDKIQVRLSKEYPKIICSHYSPPYKIEFDELDNQNIFDSINKFNPDILLLGMTCPKQEKWIYNYRNEINFKMSISIGGVFDWYAGNRKEIPQIWWKLKLGWLYRIVQRPEIIKRNFGNIMIFLSDLIKEVFKVGK